MFLEIKKDRTKVNASNILYLDTRSKDGTVCVYKDEQTADFIPTKEWTTLEEKVKKITSFKSFNNFGYINLDNVVEYTFVNEKDSVFYRFEFINNKNIVFIKGVNMEELDNTFDKTHMGGKDPEPEKTPTELTPKPTSVSVEEGKTADVNVTTEATEITAESSDTSKATVKVSGKKVTVTGVKEGSANITIKGTAEGHTEGSVVVKATVTAKAVEELTPVTLNLSKNKTSILEKGTEDITYTTDAEKVTAEVNNSNVTAEVKEGQKKITLTAKTKGSAKVTVKGTASGKKEVTKTIDVTVTQADVQP